MIPEPYSYPAVPHTRFHGPSGWTDYQRYRPWLRDEFVFRCVYCLDREVWRDMRERLHIDHFQAQALRPDLRCDYDNLLYLCPACNGLKRDSILPDPCQFALGECLRVYPDGRIEARNPEGERLLEVLALDEPLARRRRQLIIGTVLSLAETSRPMFVQWMQYPQDLPNLSEERNTPPANSKPQGIARSHYERKRKGELPEVY